VHSAIPSQCLRFAGPPFAPAYAPAAVVAVPSTGRKRGRRSAARFPRRGGRGRPWPSAAAATAWASAAPPRSRHLAAGLTNLGLGRHRQILELRHARGTARRTLGGLRDEVFRRRRLRGLDPGGLIVIREQRRLLGDRPHRDVTVGSLLQRRG